MNVDVFFFFDLFQLRPEGADLHSSWNCNHCFHPKMGVPLTGAE